MSSYSDRSIYLRGITVGALARGVTTVTAFAAFWMITQTLSRAEFGKYSLSLSIIALLSIVAPLGLHRTLMYRIARRSGEPGELVGREFMSTVLFFVLLSSTSACVLLIALTDRIESAFGYDGLSLWLVVLAMTVPVDAARMLYGTWLNSRQRVAETIAHNQILFSVLRLAGVAAIWRLWPEPLGLAVVLLLSSTLVLLLWAYRYPVLPRWHRGVINTEDLAYGIKVMLGDGVNRGVGQLNVILVGALSTATVVADYAVAVRLTFFVPMGNALLNTIFMPRIGGFLEREEHAALAREYDATRVLGLLAGMLVSFSFALVGERVLALFGDYSGAYSILLVLAAGFIVAIATGSNATYLNMTGRSGWFLAVSIVTLVFNIALTLRLTPSLGGLGAALALTIATSTRNLLLSWVLLRVEGFTSFSWPLAVHTAAFATGLLWQALGAGRLPLGSWLIGLSLIAFVVHQRRQLQSMALALLSRARGR